MYTSKLKASLFFLSIPISGFIPSDRFARNGPVRLSLISSVLLLLGKTKSFVFLSLIRRTHCPAELLTTFVRHHRSDVRTFGKPNRTLVPAPMVFRHKTLHLTAELTGKENTTGNLQQQEAGPSGLFPERISFLKSRPICNSVITLVGGDRDWRPLELWRVSSYFF